MLHLQDLCDASPSIRTNPQSHGWAHYGHGAQFSKKTNGSQESQNNSKIAVLVVYRPLLPSVDLSQETSKLSGAGEMEASLMVHGAWYSLYRMRLTGRLLHGGQQLKHLATCDEVSGSGRSPGCWVSRAGCWAYRTSRPTLASQSILP